MNWFGARRAVATMEPAPIDAKQAAWSRVEETYAAMALAKLHLDDASDEIAQFRRTYSILENKFGQVTSCVIPPGKTRREINLLHEALARRLARALHVFSARLRAWSEAKEANK